MSPKKHSVIRNAASIAEVSAASVGGYLHNVARRTRVPRAEGGKGTRRKVGVVSSHHHPDPSLALENEGKIREEEKEEKVMVSAIPSANMNNIGIRILNSLEDQCLEINVDERVSEYENITEGIPCTMETKDTKSEIQEDMEEGDEWDEVIFPTVITSNAQDAADIKTLPSDIQQDNVVPSLSSVGAMGTEVNQLVKQEVMEIDLEDSAMGPSNLSMPAVPSSLPAVTDDLVECKVPVSKDRAGHHRTTVVWCGSEMKAEELMLSGGITASAFDDGKGENFSLDSSTGTSTSPLNSRGAAQIEGNDFQAPRNERIETQNSSTWHRGEDPAYEEMRERRDQLAARRRSQRIQKVYTAVTELIFLLCRGQWLWREARRPSILEGLLRVRQVESLTCCAPSLSSVEKYSPLQTDSFFDSTNGAATSSSTQKRWTLPLVAAVKAAKESVTRAQEACALKPSLTPAWVTLEQDGVKNHTSAAVTVLIQALNQCFQVDCSSSSPSEMRRDEWKNTRHRTSSENSGQVKQGTRNLFDHVEPTTDAMNASNPEGEVAHQTCTNTNTNTATSVDVTPPSSSSFSAASFLSWSVPLKKSYLSRLLRRAGKSSSLMRSSPHLLEHPLYLCVLFLSLAALSRLEARIVIAMKETGNFSTLGTDKVTGDTAEEREKDENEALFLPKGRLRETRETLGMFSRKKRSRSDTFTGLPSSFSNTSGCSASPATASAQKREKRQQPTSCFWIEVWSPERLCFFSVNPCKGITTLWGAPYVFGFGKGRVVDITPRYTSSLSKSYLYFQRLGRCTNYRFLWKDKVSWDDTREVSDVLIEKCCSNPERSTTELSQQSAKTSPRSSSSVMHKFRSAALLQQIEREQRQLESLRYSEPIPHTLSLLHRHPLFIIESDLSRMEGIYPKDRFHIVGSVKGHVVYKRSAIQNLRSRDGWIREGRSILTEEEDTPYKIVPPPSSRPFAAPSHFFGYWQTKPFTPQTLTTDYKLPQHGSTKWYILLHGHSPPPGICHKREPNIVKVARRMQLDFRLAVVGFEHKKVQENRRGSWFPIIEGIIIQEKDNIPLTKAYTRWVQLAEEQAAAKRKERSLHWWKFLYQRILAMDRMQRMYCKGLACSFPLE